ncbi:hypothetical protein [Rugamonas apoptosis]|uniref:Uncharacterized protein n=1 Tax=Rugamonas apoptosis TaxID=2758570 RepID=A0A7W2IIW4_9BURK|nr:hypothetical protein [Rugamonas apoptosis]MBA5685923.1 hypothetical protein [Rugamonas apoptosis]
MNTIKIAIFATVLTITTVSASAANPCISYATEANAAIAKALAADSVRTFNDIYFNSKGAFVLNSDYSGQNYDFILKSYTLPASLGKKMYYRFTDATYKGIRNGTGAIVCSMRGEFSDGFSVNTDVRNFDIDHQMVYSREEANGGMTFVPAGLARWVIVLAISKTVVNDPTYKAEMAKFQ